MAIPGTAASTPTTKRALPVAPSPPESADWPKQATDSIVRVVDSVRDKTTGPAVAAARAVVYGTILAVLGLPLSVLLLVGLMRITERLLIMLGEWQQWSFLAEPMWLVYLLFGSAFFLVGVRLWAKAKQPLPNAP